MLNYYSRAKQSQQHPGPNHTTAKQSQPHSVLTVSEPNPTQPNGCFCLVFGIKCLDQHLFNLVMNLRIWTYCCKSCAVQFGPVQSNTVPVRPCIVLSCPVLWCPFQSSAAVSHLLQSHATPHPPLKRHPVPFRPVRSRSRNHLGSVTLTPHVLELVLFYSCFLVLYRTACHVLSILRQCHVSFS